MANSSQPCIATEEDLKRLKRKCWNPSCKRKAFLRDWKGWQWCFFCWWRQVEYHWLIELRYLRIF